MQLINNNNMFKKTIKKPTEEVRKEIMTKAEAPCGNVTDECFLKTINHPRKIELATGLLNGEDPESFYDDYGSIRVMEMMKMISNYNEDPERYLKSRQISGCASCGRG